MKRTFATVTAENVKLRRDLQSVATQLTIVCLDPEGERAKAIVAEVRAMAPEGSLPEKKGLLKRIGQKLSPMKHQ